jgi:hypothetical protein
MRDYLDLIYFCGFSGTVKGSLHLECCPILTLPKELYIVGGSLYITRSQVTNLPDVLHVDGFVDLEYSRNITKLPEDFKVGGGWLDLHGTGITEVPIGIVCMGLA